MDSSGFEDTGISSSVSEASGMAARISPASGTDSGVGVTNILADLGPACTSTVAVLRETLNEITKLLSSNGASNSKSPLSEGIVARLIYFFAERGTRRSADGDEKNSSDAKAGLSSALVGTLLPTKDNDVGNGGIWNLDVVSEVIRDDYSNLDWLTVAKKWDFPDFKIRDIDHIRILLSLYRSGSGKDVPLNSITCTWQNQVAQLSFLEYILAVPPRVYTFPVNEAESADAATAVSDGKSTSTCPNPQGWASVSVLLRLLSLSDVSSLARRVRDLFVRGLLSCPEVLLCALVRLQLSVASAAAQGGRPDAAQNVGVRMKGELMRELIPLFFKPNPHHRVQNGPAALRRLWAISPNTVAAACIEAWRSTNTDTPQTRLATVVHIISIVRLLPSPESVTAAIINGNKDFEFGLAVAFVMADNDMLQLSAWLSERMSTMNSSGSTGNGRVIFAIAIVSYIGKMYASALSRGNHSGKGTPLVSIENISVCLQFLNGLDKNVLSQALPSSLSGGGDSSNRGMLLGESVKALTDACMSAHPSLSSLMSNSSSAPSSSRTPTPTSGSTDDIEEMANSYFQKIYTSEQSIGEVIEMLKRFKVSGNARENDIFACMIHNLFDEYRFFSKYPEKELRITGILFGQLIQQQLVSSITLGIALRYVLEALRKPPSPPGSTTSNSGKMFRFGMFALEQFKSRLHEWPQYCSHIVQIPYLREGYGALVNEIEEAMEESSQNRATSSVEPVASSSGDDTGNSLVELRENGGKSNDVNEQVSSDGGHPLGQPLGSAALSMPVPTGSNSSSVGNQSGTSMPSSIELLPSALGLSTPFQQVQPRKKVEFGEGLGRAVNGKVDSETQHEAPPDSVLDRVQFLINNVSPSNVEQKSQELKDMLDPNYFGWLGHYLVVKRISTQPNFHSLYLTFLDQLGDYGKGLVDAILSSVYLNVGKLLRSPKITTSTSERSLLKNLGSWLGQITLARNRPILQIMLDCKELLFQGYETGMLIAVTPFVAKILEGAKNSSVFRPPNPWLMGLLSVFRALYGVEDLKMNIKFEVEVLCKNMGFKLEDIPLRTDDLSKRFPPEKAKNPDFNLKSVMVSKTSAPTTSSNQGSGSSTGGSSMAGHTVGVTPGSSLLLNTEGKAPVGMRSSAPTSVSLGPSAGGQFTLPSAVGQGSSKSGSTQEHQTVIPNLAAYVTINPSILELFQQGHGGQFSSKFDLSTLKANVPIAVDRAIREIIQPVVERSVTIACITTKEIVTKDFAMESDENKMRKAAQLMVANMAGSLALVTCREPLRVSVSTHLMQLLTSTVTGSSADGSKSSASQLNDQEQSALEQCVAICATDNLELGCMLIEKAATEKAVRDMDEALAPSLNARRKHREQTGQPFYDMSIFGNGSQRYPSALPEPLRPKPGGLRREQLLVYEAFQRMPRQPVASSQQQQQSTVAGPTGMVIGGPSSSDRDVNLSSSNNVPAGNAAASAVSGQQQFNVDALSAIAGKLDSAVTTLLSAAGPRAPEITLSMLPADHDVRQLLAAVQRVAAAVTSNSGEVKALTAADTDTILGFAQGVFKRLYELSLSEPLRLEALVALLEALKKCCAQLGSNLGTWATYAPTETAGQRKLHRTVLLLLVRSSLIPIGELDSFLTRNTDGGRNAVWVEFALLFVRTAVLERIASPSDLPKVMDVMTRIADGRSQANQQIIQAYRKPILRMLEELRSASSKAEGHGQPVSSTVLGPESNESGETDAQNTYLQSSSMSETSLNNLAEATKKAADSTEATARKDPTSAKQQITFLLDSWIRVHSEAAGNEKAYAQYLQLLQQHGVGKSDEQTERFFRLSTAIVVNAVLKTGNADDDSSNGKESKHGRNKPLNYSVIDAYCKLIAILIRYMNSGGSTEQVAAQRISLLNKVLGITIRTMMANYELNKQESGGIVAHWDQRPWYRLLLNLVMDLNSPSPALDPISLGILSVFGSAFHVVQPLVVPGFAFAWLELVSHRKFLSNLLLVKGQNGWGVAHQLLIDLFLFLEPHLRKTELTEPIKHLYKGTMRVLLVLLHDFPAFLAAYHLSFCNVIPENCVQLRNLVLSAFPRGLVLPDPFTPNLKIDLLPEVSLSPTILSNVAGPLESIRSDLDGYLKSRQPADFLSGLLPRLCKDGSDDVDGPRVNSLVLYVGIHALARLQNSQGSPTLAHTPEMEILQKLMEFGDRGRYISLNAIANQLRYPSSHTHYYSCVMLFIFSEAQNEGVKEQVTRVLLERLIVHRPHPWGLLITFIELIKNQHYQFWSHPFTRCATEIEKVFESVARSCMPPTTHRSVTTGGDDA
eukprot:scaffold6570_cov51-Attheya_sp.AAC.6